MQKEIYPHTIKNNHSINLEQLQYSFGVGVKWLLEEKYPQLPVRPRANGIGASHNKPNKSFNKDLKRLQKGEPVDYIIGFKDFLGCRIDLSKKPLIPRLETEFWTQKAIGAIRDSKKRNIKVLDIFSGSGCIGISIMSRLQSPDKVVDSRNNRSNRGSSAPIKSRVLDEIGTKPGRHSKDIHVTFADLKENMISQIKINCKINGIDEKRYKIIKSNIFSKIKEKYDYIFANPPYIPEKRIHKIQTSVLRYEPKEALFGGEDGLIFIKIFLGKTFNYLNPGGEIFMEFDSPQKNKIEKLIENYKYKGYNFYKDQYGRWRYVVIK